MEVVYSQGCHARYADDGSANPLGVPLGVRDETSVAIGGELGDHSIGRLEGYCRYGKQFSAIVWGKRNVRDNGVDDNKVYYDMVVLGSSRVFQYDEWDLLYSPVSQFILDRE